jgi:hypothetical protein
MLDVEFIVYDKKTGRGAKQRLEKALAGRVFDAFFIVYKVNSGFICLGGQKLRVKI